MPTTIGNELARIQLLNLLNARRSHLESRSDEVTSYYQHAATSPTSGIVMTREDFEHQERLLLAPFAAKSAESRGRVDAYEPPHPIRTAFMRDRDRIMHSFRLRRLEKIRQVAYTSDNPYKRSRLTHTMEVVQLTLSGAEALRLNTALAMAAAFGHDSGHAPFGHDGETALNEIMKRVGGRFEHNLQGYRTLRYLTRYHPKQRGLNLTLETMYCIIMHCSPYDSPDYSIVDLELPASPPAEGQLVNCTDEIAYIAHDTDDALQSRILTFRQSNHVGLFRNIVHAIHKEHGRLAQHVERHQIKQQVIDILFNDMLVESARRIRDLKPQSIEDIYNSNTPIIGFSEKMMPLKEELRQFLHENVYAKGELKIRADEAKGIIKKLFYGLLHHPDKRPPELARIITLNGGEKNIHQSICNYIASLTDRQAREMVQSFLSP